MAQPAAAAAALQLAPRDDITTDDMLRALVDDAIRDADRSPDVFTTSQDASLTRLVVPNTLGNGSRVYATPRGDAIVLRIEGRRARLLNVLLRGPQPDADVVAAQAVRLAIAPHGVMEVDAQLQYVQISSHAGQPRDDEGWAYYAYEDALEERMHRLSGALTTAGLVHVAGNATWNKQTGSGGDDDGDGDDSDTEDVSFFNRVNVTRYARRLIELDSDRPPHVARPRHALTWLASRPHANDLVGYRIVTAPRPGGDWIDDRVQVLAYRARLLSPNAVHVRIILEPLLVNECPHTRARWLAEAVRVMGLDLWDAHNMWRDVGSPHTIGVLVDEAQGAATIGAALVAGGFRARQLGRDDDGEPLVGPTGAPLPLSTTLYALRFARQQTVLAVNEAYAANAAVAAADPTNADEAAYRNYWLVPPTVHGGGADGGGRKRLRAV